MLSIQPLRQRPLLAFNRDPLVIRIMQYKYRDLGSDRGEIVILSADRW